MTRSPDVVQGSADPVKPLVQGTDAPNNLSRNGCEACAGGEGRAHTRARAREASLSLLIPRAPIRGLPIHTLHHFTKVDKARKEKEKFGEGFGEGLFNTLHHIRLQPRARVLPGNPPCGYAEARCFSRGAGSRISSQRRAVDPVSRLPRGVKLNLELLQVLATWPAPPLHEPAITAARPAASMASWRSRS